MNETEIIEILKSCGFKENTYGGVQGVMKGIQFTICMHPLKGLCFMGHKIDKRTFSEFEEYLSTKDITKEAIAIKILNICEEYS